MFSLLMCLIVYCFLSVLQALPRSAPPSGRTGPLGLPAHPNAGRGGGGDAAREEEEETTKAVEEGDASGPIRKTGTARGDSASRVSHIDTIN